jgi:hypothetical protein
MLWMKEIKDLSLLFNSKLDNDYYGVLLPNDEETVHLHYLQSLSLRQLCKQKKSTSSRQQHSLEHIVNLFSSVS